MENYVANNNNVIEGCIMPWRNLPSICSVETIRTTNQDIKLYTHYDSFIFKNYIVYAQKNDWKYDSKMLIMVLPNVIMGGFNFLCKSV